MRRVALLVMLAACGETTSHQLAPESVDFGRTACGTTAVPHVFSIENTNDHAVTFDAVLAAGDASMYTVSPSHGVVLAGNQIEVTIVSRAIPASSAVTDNLYGDTLTITTDLDHDTPHAIAITQTASGAVLAFTPASLDFGTNTLATTGAPVAFTLANTGNAAATVAFHSSDPAYTVTAGEAQAVAAGATATGQVSFLARVLGAAPATVTVETTDVVCSAPPALAVTANGSARGTAVEVALAPRRGRPNSGGDFLGTSSLTVCVLTSTHRVLCTGSNDFGARGAGSATVSATAVASYNTVVTDAGVLDGVDDVQGGRGMFCAHRTNDEMWCWGDFNGAGRHDGAASESHPYAAKIADGVAAIGLGYSTRCFATRSSGTVACSGAQNGSAAGFPFSGWTTDGAKAVAAFGGTVFAVMADGSLQSFGENTRGERGSDVASEAPGSAVPLQAAIASVAIGASGGTHATRHACAALADGSAWCWGQNRHGQLGIGTASSRDDTNRTPAQVLTADATPLTDVTQVTAGQVQSCARTTAGDVYCWGRNAHGELGRLGADSAYAVKVDGLPAMQSLVSTQRATCGVTAAGGVRCWGGDFGATPAPLDVFEP